MISPKPNRVLMTADTMGGVWTYALELISAFEAADIEIVLALMGRQPDAEQRGELRKHDNVVLRSSDFKLEWMHGCWHDVAKAGDWLLLLEDIYRPNLIHLSGYVHATMAFKAPKLVVGHSCVLSWWRD